MSTEWTQEAGMTGDPDVDNVQDLAESASTSATSAANSATSASNSATAAANSATSAASSASGASTSASNASTSASNAASSATSAGSSATSATSSKNAAAASETAAAASETAAAASETAAASSETNAASSASSASSSASSASSSASTATTKASEASTSATNAANSATSASTSASTATTQASNASTSATAAASSASAASTSASNASTSETNAATSASNASTSASNASTSETNAANSATSAANSATSAAASYDSFDDRYLGAKSSAPTVDNDGDALLTGALYYNTTAGQLYIWDGSIWDDAAFSASGSVTSFNTRTGAVTLTSSDVNTALGSDAVLDSDIGSTVQAYSSVLQNTTASYTTAEETKLAGIETGATADQTAGEIKTAYESNADTNAFTDAEQTKLSGIEALADVTDTTNVTAAGAVMDSELTSEASVKALNQGVATTDSPSFAGLTVDTNTLYVDSTNNRVGIGTNSPSRSLMVRRTAGSQASGEIYADDGTQWYQFNSNSGGGNYNPLVSAGDHTFIYSNGTQNTGSLVIGPWSSSAIGMRIDSSGNVGIGTSNPTFTLDVSGSTNTFRVKATSPLIRLEDSDDGAYHTLIGSSDDFYISADAGNTGAGNMIFRNGGSTERMRIDSSGNVGIGTSSPGEKLNVSTGSSEYAIQWNSTGSNNWVLGSSSNRAYIVNKSTPLEVLTILNGGNIGIGTSSPGGMLHLSGALPRIYLTDTDTSTLSTFSGENGWLTLSAATSRITFTIASSEKMRIVGDNVGIGTSSPSSILHLASTGSAILTIEADTDNVTETDNARIILKQDGGVVVGRIGYVDGGNALEIINEYGSDSLLFGTSNTERMRIDSSGNVGIGTSSPSYKLHVSGDIYATGNVTAYSDIKLKENVKTVENAVDLVNKMRGVTFTRKDTGEDGVGVIAQEMQKVLPQVVTEKDGIIGVAYGNIVGVLIEAVKELSAEVKRLKEKN